MYYTLDFAMKIVQCSTILFYDVLPKCQIKWTCTVINNICTVWRADTIFDSL